VIPTKMRRATVAWLDSRHAARTVQVVAVLALFLSVWFGVQQYQLTACQAKYAEVSNASQRARARAAEVDRQAQDALFVQVAEQPRNAISAIRAYNASRAEADRQRAANPIPPPPSTKCG
jgi:hypothetical protein